MTQERSPISIGHRDNDDHNLFFLIRLECNTIITESELKALGFDKCSKEPKPNKVRLKKGNDGSFTVLSVSFRLLPMFSETLSLLPHIGIKPSGYVDFCVAFEKWLKDGDNKWGGYEFNEDEKKSADARIERLIKQLTRRRAEEQLPGPLIDNPVVQQPFQPNELQAHFL